MNQSKIYKQFHDPKDMDLSRIMQQMKTLIPKENKSDITGDLEQIKDIIQYMLPRKEEKLYEQINKTNMAEFLVSFIPTESFEEISQKAESDDPDSLLQLADCYYFGFKQQTVDTKKAEEIYEQAASLKQPEAMTVYAANIYLKLIKQFGLTSIDAKLTKSQLGPLCDHLLSKLWYLIESCAILDYISPIFVFQAQQAERLGMSITNMSVDALLRRDAGQCLEFDFIATRNCANGKCERVIFAEETKSIVFCMRCLKSVYCCIECQQNDWDSHVNSCLVDARCGLPNARALAVEDMMNRDFDHLMATNYGSTDTQRYANALSSNFLHLNKKINNVAKQFHEMIGRGLLPDFVEISSVVLEQEDIAIRTLMAARSRALPSNITIEQLSNRAYSAMQRHHFSNAVKNFSFAIDKLMIETPISRMDDAEKRRLIKFYAKRAECNLELAKANHSEEFILKVLEDCSFVLETGVFVRAFVEAETEICACLKKLLKKAQELKEEIGTYGVESRTTTVVTETANQRRRRRRQEREMEKEKLMEIVEENQIIDASLCSELGDVTKTTEKLAINAYSEEGECPICSTRWCDFMEPKVAAILPCAHACCAECLLLYHKSCNDEDVEEQDRCSFGCPLCRKNLDEELFSKLAQAFVNKRLIDSFNFLAKSLPYEQEEMDKILLSLIKTYDFDLSKVEYSLFNMVGLVDKSPDLNLNYEEKQQFYNEARAPVVLLYSELAELREKLHYIDHESEDGKETRKKLEKVNINLRVAMRNASSTIFERVNSKENNIFIGEDGTEVHCVDLHGLHLNEAKEIVKENILPVLMVVNQIMIITGRGKHSQNGKAVLKNAIKEYFGQLQFRCQDIVKNEGAFYVYSNNME